MTFVYWLLLYFIGFYGHNTPPVEYTPQNPLCRFKAIAYSVKPTSSSRDALIAVIINKKMDEIRW